MKPLPRYTSRLFGKPLAMASPELHEIMQYVGDRTASGGRVRRTAASKDSIPRSRARAYLKNDGVLVIPVFGTLVHQSGWMDAECAMQSYEALAEDLDVAMEGNCRGVMLRLNSPGGECAGLFTLADKLQAVAQAKPIWGVVDDMACSAAYLLAAYCERLYISKTAVVGSIGVIAQHLDQSGWDEKNGLRYTAVFAGARKNDGTPHEALSDPALQNLQAEVDRIYGMFVDCVAARRGQSVSSIRAQEGKVYYAQAAIDAGLADEFGSPDDAYRALLDRISTAPTSATGAVARPMETKTMKKLHLAAGKRITPTAKKEKDEEYPDDVEQLKSAAEPEEEEEEEEKDPAAEQSKKKGRAMPVDEQDDEQDEEKDASKANGAAQEICALCSIAGQPHLAAEYIVAGKTIAEVRADLLAGSKTSHTVQSAITASTGAKTFNAFDPASNPLLADAQRRASANQKEKR